MPLFEKLNLKLRDIFTKYVNDKAKAFLEFQSKNVSIDSDCTSREAKIRPPNNYPLDQMEVTPLPIEFEDNGPLVEPSTEEDSGTEKLNSIDSNDREIKTSDSVGSRKSNLWNLLIHN